MYITQWGRGYSGRLSDPLHHLKRLAVSIHVFGDYADYIFQ